MLLLYRSKACICHHWTFRVVDVQSDVSELVCDATSFSLIRAHSSPGFSSYNLRHQDVSIYQIAYHRTAAVVLGVVWAAIVSRFWWPSEARRELSDALSELSDISDCVYYGDH